MLRVADGFSATVDRFSCAGQSLFLRGIGYPAHGICGRQTEQQKNKGWQDRLPPVIGTIYLREPGGVPMVRLMTAIRMDTPSVDSGCTFFEYRRHLLAQHARLHWVTASTIHSCIGQGRIGLLDAFMISSARCQSSVAPSTHPGTDSIPPPVPWLIPQCDTEGLVPNMAPACAREFLALSTTSYPCCR